MGFPFRECNEILLQGLLAALAANEDFIRSLRTETGYHPASGLDFELVPWHARVYLSLRSASDRADQPYHDPDSWAHGYFVDSHMDSGAMLREAARYISDRWESSDSERDGLRDTAHMIFLAGAEALLNPQVGAFLQKTGVDAPIIADAFPRNTCFRYTVFDSDATVKANYCEIVLANRVASRLLEG